VLCTNFKEAEVLNLGAKIFVKSYLRGIREIKYVSVGLLVVFLQKKALKDLKFEFPRDF
jgi:hypothetical protein